MTTPNSVLGVSGVCWVGFRNSAQVEPLYYAAFRVVCGVCWVWLRVRACVTIFDRPNTRLNFSYAKTDKPNKPNTLNTKLLKVLNLKGFICVGFVLGVTVFVLGSIFRGMGR